MKNIFTTCDRCGKDIYYGQPHISISRNIETVENNIANQTLEADVLSSDEVSCLCSRCGSSFDAEKIAQIINIIPYKIMHNLIPN
jgi:protein-arginine kinase activator protein McsA